MNIEAKQFFNITQNNNANHKLTIENDTDNHIETAKVTFKEKILQFLSRIPLFQNFSIVENYVKQTEFQNQRLLSQFIISLSNTFGYEAETETKLLYAIESVHLKHATPLTARHIKIMTDKFENFNGIGAAKDLPKKIQINIWPYKNMDHFGHASMSVLDENNEEDVTHISWWPDKSGTTPNKYDTYFGQRTAKPNISYTEDAFNELSSRAKNKLEIAYQIRQHQNDRTLKDYIDEQIDDTLSDITRACQAEINKDKEQKTTFFANMPLEQRKTFLRSVIDKDCAEREKNVEGKTTSPIAIISSTIYENMADIIIEKILEKVNTQNTDIYLDAKSLKEITATTKQQLAPGSQLREKIFNSFIKLRYSYIPLARQEKTDENQWVINSEKIYLPIIGKQSQNNQETFVIFGLNEQSIKNFWLNIQEQIAAKTAGYTLASKTENCASMVARVLIAGGAEQFIPFKVNQSISSPKEFIGSFLTYNPNDVQKYALDLQRRIDQLNQDHQKIRAFYVQIKELNQYPDIINADISKLKENFELELKQMSPADNRRFSKLSSVIKNFPTNQNIDISELTRHGIQLVETLNTLLSQATINSEISPDSKALFIAATLTEALEKRIQESMKNRTTNLSTVNSGLSPQVLDNDE